MNVALIGEELRRALPDDSAGLSEKSQAAARRKRWLFHCMLAAFVCSLHHWTALLINRGDYTPFAVSEAVSALTLDETHAYVPPAQRFLLTGRIPAEVDNYERRNSRAGIPFAPAAILGSLGWLLGGLDRAFIAADVIFPGCLFLCFYWFTADLIERQSLRLLIAWSTLLVPFGLKNVFWLGNDPLVAPLEVTRTPQPEISFLFLMGAVALTARAIQQKASWWWTIAAGFASGLLIYSYYFYAVGWIIALLLLIVFTLLWKHPYAARRAAYIFALMGLVGIPYTLVAMEGKRQGGQTYLLERMGIYTHTPEMGYLLLAIALSGAFLVFGRRFLNAEPRYVVLVFLILGGVWGVNSQIVSGYNAQHWHFWKRLVKPAEFLLFACVACRIAEQLWMRSGRRLQTLAGALVVCLVLNAAARQCYSAAQIARVQRTTNPRIEVLNWARRHLSTGRVLGTLDPDLILLIPALTADYTYAPSGLRSLTPTDEIVARYYELAAWLDTSDADLAQIMRAPRHYAPSEPQLLFALRLYDGSKTNWSAGQVISSTAMRPIDNNVLSAAFREQYRRFRAMHPRSRLHARLDDLILPARARWPSNVAGTFPRARVVHTNSQFALIELAP
jgi:hypothetical protein